MRGQRGSSSTIIVIVVLILVLLGIWYWSRGASKPADNAASAALGDTSALETDLNATDVSTAGDVQAIDTATTGN